MAMRKTIERSIITTKVSLVQIVVKDGVVSTLEMSPLNVVGKVSKEQATKDIQKAYGKDFNFAITNIEETEERYEISVDDFMKYATKVEPEKEVVETEPTPPTAE